MKFGFLGMLFLGIWDSVKSVQVDSQETKWLLHHHRNHHHGSKFVAEFLG